MDLIGVNAGIVRSVAENIAKHSPNAVIIVVSNPLDEMTALTQLATSFPKNRVMGQAGMLDTARFTNFVAEKCGVAISSVKTLTLGSHGETMVPVPSRCTVNGKPLSEVLSADEIKDLLKDKLIELLTPIQNPLVLKGTSPFVIMVVGVNGAGKTTTIGKLTKIFLDEKKSVLIAAGDTFRAAATEQLEVWGERNNVHVVSQASGDPSAVIFDAINSAKAKNIDIVIADTAGRLPTQKHLIDEITKIKRVINKCHLEAPHEILLVLDANTGQNTISQLKIFNEALGITGLALTKLDGTAKGGVIAAIAKEQPTPLRYVGVGESIDDLKVFNAQEYVDALF